MRTPIMLAAATFLAAACTSEKQNGANSAAAGAVQAGAPAAAASPGIVTVHAKDFAYSAPAEIPAGVTNFRLVNDGPGLHHMQIVRLDSGKTAADFEQAMKHPGPPPRWVVFLGGPNAPSPADTSNATIDMQPGSYAIICMVDVPDGVPHFAKGMVHPFTVKPAIPGAAVAAAPSADIHVTLQDYGFIVSAPITAGAHVLDVHNIAAQPHEIEVVKLAPGKTAQDMLAWLGKMQGPPPGTPVGGIAALVPGTHEAFSADFAAGDYALICFVPDAKDGKPHFTHGMVHTITVS